MAIGQHPALFGIVLGEAAMYSASFLTSAVGGSTTKAATIMVVVNMGNTNLFEYYEDLKIGHIGADIATVKLEELSDGPYDFTFTVTYSNGVQKQQPKEFTFKGIGQSTSDSIGNINKEAGRGTSSFFTPAP